jgi:hypothetical protein
VETYLGISSHEPNAPWKQRPSFSRLAALDEFFEVVDGCLNLCHLGLIADIDGIEDLFVVPQLLVDEEFDDVLRVFLDVLLGRGGGAAHVLFELVDHVLDMLTKISGVFGIFDKRMGLMRAQTGMEYRENCRAAFFEREVVVVVVVVFVVVVVVWDGNAEMCWTKRGVGFMCVHGGVTGCPTCLPFPTLTPYMITRFPLPNRTVLGI